MRANQYKTVPPATRVTNRSGSESALELNVICSSMAVCGLMNGYFTSTARSGNG
ncbi:hypothetical protein AArcCO_2061 [Halalkaliarchaeum sp. AArc-CO]|nr:hypothetical protein AArcCO_2061 [Halalkaliarchaeum sp. AArc-CO]